MLKLCIGDKLLIKSTSFAADNWQYRIVHLETATTVKSEIEINILETYKVITLDSSTFLNYKDKTLLLEILNEAGIVQDTDMFLVSGLYNQLTNMQLLVGLLGENIKKTASNDSDWQDGYSLSKTITTYNEIDLTTILQAYSWTQSFVTDFTPDARYHVQKIKQIES